MVHGFPLLSELLDVPTVTMEAPKAVDVSAALEAEEKAVSLELIFEAVEVRKYGSFTDVKAYVLSKGHKWVTVDSLAREGFLYDTDKLAWVVPDQFTQCGECKKPIGFKRIGECCAYTHKR